MGLGNYGAHRRHVEVWLERAEKGLANEQLVDLLEQALERLSAAALESASEVTIAAVLDRSIVETGDLHRWLPPIAVAGASADFSAFRAAAPGLKRESVLHVSAFLLSDFLAILGNLTAEVLTRGLHHELSQVRLNKPRRPKNGGSKRA